MPGDRDDDRAEPGGRAVSLHAVRDVCANNCVINRYGWGILETYLPCLTGVHGRRWAIQRDGSIQRPVRDYGYGLVVRRSKSVTASVSDGNASQV